MTNEQVRHLGEQFLEPYEIPDSCPHLSDDQRELSLLTFTERARWMGEWLAMAAATKEAAGE